ncbi:MAG TPA: beta-ketoacyl synthase chain length factor [Steroidobacteraceae bacterium]|nr:beta-ketoacyl synthase chain length factor [Steroidobacteraceae bacterium]
MNLSVYVEGIGILGPGLQGWPAAAAVLSGRSAYQAAATALAAPALLPAAERRRTGRVVKLAIGIALEATAQAGADASKLPSVFSSSGGDGYNCHEICESLAAHDRAISPTRFSNSVHNAAAGYWSIATGAMSASNVLCAFDASFGAGLLDAVAQVRVNRESVLLAAYDTEYPAPLHDKRPIPDAFGIGLVLSDRQRPQSIAQLAIRLTGEQSETLAEPQLEQLRRSIPAARGLPLLRRLAMRSGGGTILDYLDDTRLSIEVQPCF